MTIGAGRGRPALSWGRTSTLVLCGCLVLTGCSDGTTGSGKSAAATSSSPARPTTDPATSPPTSPPTSPAAGATEPVETPTASPRPAAEKAPRTPPAKRGRAAQRRFARHVMAAWAYGLRTNDSTALTRLSPARPRCKGCRAFAQTLAQRRKQGWSVDFAGPAVRSIRLDQQRDDITYAKAKVDIPQSDSFNRDGSYRNTSRAHRGATFQVLMRYTGTRYRLLAFTVS